MSSLTIKPKLSLVLSGGGARGAYQAGVLKAIAELTRSYSTPIPFPVVTGVSAGAINAAFIAAHAHDFDQATDELVNIWKRVTTEQVFLTDALSMSRIGLRLITDITTGNFATHKTAKALLDTSPLRTLLSQIPFDQIQAHIDSGHLEALAITALDYTSSHSCTFVQGQAGWPNWRRFRRHSVSAEISVDHIMASSALPLFFPPIEIKDRFYGDGCLRNSAPLSPAVHLDSDRLLIIGVRAPGQASDFSETTVRPSVARILSVVLNGVLMDAIDADVERLAKVNETMELVPAAVRSNLDYKKLDYCWMRPSEDIGNIAAEYADRLPKLIRYLLGGLGSTSESSELVSYLLFDPDYCGRLVDIGYRDGLAAQDQILGLLSTPLEESAATGA